MTTNNILVKHLKHKNILLDGDQIYHVNAYGYLRPYSNFDFKLDNDPDFNCGDASFIDLLNPKDETNKSKYKEIYDYITENRNSIMGTTIQLNEQCKTEGNNIEYQNQKDGNSGSSNYSRFAYINARGEKSDFRDHAAFMKGKHSDKCPGTSILVNKDQFNAPKNTGYYADNKPFCKLVPKRTPSKPTPNSYPDEAYPNKRLKKWKKKWRRNMDNNEEDNYQEGRNREVKKLPPYIPHYKLDRQFNRSSNVKPDFSLGTDGTRDSWNMMTSMGDFPYGRRGNRRVTYSNEFDNIMNMPFLREATSEISRVNTGLYMRMILWFVLLCILLMLIVKIRNSNVSISSFGSSSGSVSGVSSASSGVVI